MFYLPLFSEGLGDVRPNATQYEATTKAFGATLDCEQLEIGNDLAANVVAEVATVNATISSPSGKVLCLNSERLSVQKCLNERSALEMVVTLKSQENSTQEEADVCARSVILGYFRGPRGICPLGKDVTLGKENTLFVHCRPRMIAGTANVRVDALGRLQQPSDDLLLDDNAMDNSSSLFSNDPLNLIRQSNRFLFRKGGTSWHNESIATTAIGFFMFRESNSRRLFDPNQPIPTMDDVMMHLNQAYSKLFAIWLGRNKKHLFVPISDQEASQTTGYQLQPQQRLFMSTTMFIIAEAILSTYVFVAIWVYARRPGRYLARLPTSLAAQIGLFAASAAVQDMQDTSHLDRKGRAAHLKRINARYGYGSFVGSDGRVHIGIEKTPFVRPRARKTWLERTLLLFRKRSTAQSSL
jgi:hypothetical protein